MQRRLCVQKHSSNRSHPVIRNRLARHFCRGISNQSDAWFVRCITRQTITGKPEAEWFPEQKISMEEAIRAYTYNTAYANFEEQIKGSIAPGKLADITVLSNNLLKISANEILKTKVV